MLKCIPRRNHITPCPGSCIGYKSLTELFCIKVNITAAEYLSDLISVNDKGMKSGRLNICFRPPPPIIVLKVCTIIVF